MGKIPQLLLRQNILPRCWKFWMNKGFRIWSNSSNFGADTLRNMSLSWQGVVTQDALMVQSHIIPAAVCHQLRSREKDCSRRWLRSTSEMTEHLPLWSGWWPFSSISTSAFPSLASTLERLDTKHSFLFKVGALHITRPCGRVSEQYLHLQGLSSMCVQMRSS